MNQQEVLQMNFDTEEFLAHHGILGQKWGIRRYQNPDGSLTEAGKKKYGNSAKKLKVKTAKEAYKKRSKFSDEELDQLVKRFAKEEQLKKMSGKSKTQKLFDNTQNIYKFTKSPFGKSIIQKVKDMTQDFIYGDGGNVRKYASWKNTAYTSAGEDFVEKYLPMVIN